jgi:hypothetical protein
VTPNDTQKCLGEKNAARRILEWPEPQQQLRDEKLISHQLPNNRVGALLGFMNLESVLFRHQSCPRLLHRFDVRNLPAVVEERLAFVP